MGSAGCRTNSDDHRSVVRGFLRAQANTIEGGTSNVMRNILGERVLGLPKEPDQSRDVPWKDVPRSGLSDRGDARGQAVQRVPARGRRAR